MKVQYRERALADLEEIYRYLAQRSQTGARNVLRAIYAAVDHISHYPESSELTSDLSIRMKVIGRYRYKIFYTVSDDFIDIIHIRHAARKPLADE